MPNIDFDFGTGDFTVEAWTWLGDCRIDVAQQKESKA